MTIKTIAAGAIALTSHRRSLTSLVSLALTSCLAVLLAQPVSAGSVISNLSWEVSTNQAAAAAVDYTFSYTTASSAIIKVVTVTSPAAGAGVAPAIARTDGVGAGTVGIAGGVITYTVTAAALIPAGVTIVLEFSGLTNPTAGTYTAVLATETASAAIVDRRVSPAVTFAAGVTTEAVVVEQGLTVTVDTGPVTVTEDPSVPGMGEQSYTSRITVLTNARSGYTLTVSHSASASGSALPAVAPGLAGPVTLPQASRDQTGYTIDGTGLGDSGFSVFMGSAAGTVYADHQLTRDIVAQSTAPTGATANTITITHQAPIDLTTQTPAATGTLTYIVTANYN
jgi:hypothetical protein